MKYKIFFTAFIVIFIMSSIYAQDSIINEIAKGGKFIVRDDEQNEAMVIEDGNVEFSGTLKLGVLPQGAISNAIVVWDPDDKLLKLQDQTAGGSTLWTESGSNVYRTSGNIGIGTANPSVRLDVAGQVKISGGMPGAGKVLTSDATGLATWQTPATGGGSTLWTESGSNVYRTSGNIGIGTSNPSARLDVAGQVKITGGTPGTGKVLTSDATGLASWQTPATGGGSTLWTESGSNIYRNDGNVGIGITSPIEKLEVAGTGLFTGDVEIGQDNGLITISQESSSPNRGAKYDSPGFVGGWYGYHDFYTGINGSSSLAMRIINGNVGIGTENPSARLDVSGQVKITGGTPGIGKVLTSDATGLATWQTPAAGSGSTLWTESGSNIYRTDGNIGIGTTTPSAKLDVNGTVSAKRYVIDGLYDITNGLWDLSRGNLAQVTYNSGITPITINSDGTAGSYILVVNKNNSCTDCNMTFLGATVKYPGGVNPTLSSGSNTTDIFSFIAVDNNTFYCFYAKNLQ